MKAIDRSSELEAALKAREDELELSRGVVAKNADLQAKVASLTAELDMKMAEVDELKGELSVNADRLAHAERERVSFVSEATVSEDSLHVYRLERAKDMETSALKTAELEGRIHGLEAELSALNEQVASLKSEDAR
ncbi:autophagy-related protein 16-like [Nicotiana sylvestris]|uniref:autophagy-related protein 16-like n=1 Tax=Nicotiana sylvestris TaxID=4096 RepID=UPI00388CDC61